MYQYLFAVCYCSIVVRFGIVPRRVFKLYSDCFTALCLDICIADFNVFDRKVGLLTALY